MARILGVDIPNNKKIEYALRYVHGIGPSRSAVLVKESGVDSDLRAYQLTEEQLNRISELVAQKGYLVEGDLRRELVTNIKRLRGIRCYRGIRHEKKLPVRGQRTRTNARTRKGMRKKTV